MGYLITFAVIWAVLFGLAVFAIAATPTTVAKTDSMLVGPAIVTGVISATVTLVAAGVVTLVGAISTLFS